MKVSYVVLAYNQEEFIADAVRSALGQTYAEMEIILSDDCSSDRTFSIIQSIVGEYRGPHTVILNQNSRNLNIGGHINSVLQYAKGQIIVLAAGDDISSPDRTTKIVSLFSEKQDAYSVCSLHDEMQRSNDSSGWSIKRCEVPSTSSEPILIPLQSHIIANGGTNAGATYAYRREVFDWPRCYPSDLNAEDRILPLRASVMGGVFLIPSALVTCRRHGNNASASATIELLKKAKEYMSHHEEALLSGSKMGLIDDRTLLMAIAQLKASKQLMPLFGNLGRLGRRLWATSFGRALLKFSTFANVMFLMATRRYISSSQKSINSKHSGDL
ncbi:glycosyltransferase [Pirellulaceae bacterium SH501]